ncbi:peptide-methionine (R)-S-oxide reductase MsrB [Micromonospora sp. NPDC048169]|uniref:peptide-methionine (R)-S-oxide reductase MsrB n=1 Tax=Micromonospora sp. NPDC048169 TaxID=3154711 RepID=UPI0033F5D51E
MSLSDSELPRTEDEWRVRLSPEEFRVLREAGTEAPWTGEYVDTKTPGVYRCRACGLELFRSDDKFDSHCGWPSFDDAIPGAVKEIPDNTLGMRRTEIRCARCDSHLGHVFEGEGFTPKDTRHCVNSISVRLEPSAG